MLGYDERRAASESIVGCAVAMGKAPSSSTG